MPEWENAAGSMSAYYLPGEPPPNGAGTLGGNGIKSPICIPADFYSDSERYGCLPHADYGIYSLAHLRGRLALYDYRREDAPVVLPEVEAGAKYVYQTPRTWRTPLIVYDVEEAVVADYSELRTFLMG